MNQLLSTLRLSAIMIAMIGTAAHATTPGTITPEQDDTVQQDQNQNDDGFIEEDDQDNGQNQDDINGYGDEQDQDDNWGDDEQDQDDRRQGDGKKGQDDGKNGRDQDDGYDRGQDDGYDRGQGGKDYRPGKPGRDQRQNPRYDRRPRRLVETVNVYQQYFGGARFPLYMMVNNLQRFQGYRLQTVVINGSSDAGMGMAVFCSSQCSQMQNVGYYRTAYPIRTLGERVNPNSAQWFLELRGNFWIESIQLEFVR
jgi:hypothetical protein